MGDNSYKNIQFTEASWETKSGIVFNEIKWFKKIIIHLQELIEESQREQAIQEVDENQSSVQQFDMRDAVEVGVFTSFLNKIFLTFRKNGLAM